MLKKALTLFLKRDHLISLTKSLKICPNITLGGKKRNLLSMQKKALKKLIKLLDLETLEENLFRGQSENIGGPRVFGGQVIGQALTAAARTVPEKRYTHSLHAYFLRPGDMEYPIIYDVAVSYTHLTLPTNREV